MRRAFGVAVGLGAMLMSGTAFAAFHEVRIAEVYAGSAAAPNAHYVQLQMYSAGQTQLGGHAIVVYNAAGTSVGTVNLAAVTNGADQDTILIGTSDVTTTFGVTPDFTLPALTATGGKVCFDAEPSSIDCFSWGNYSGSLTSTTAPFAALGCGSAAKITIAGGTSASKLDLGDDTGNSAADFAAGAPTPKNNGRVTGAADAGTGCADAGPQPPADASTPPPKDSGVDSGISTTPTPPREGGASGSDAATDGAGGGSSDDSGCSLGAHPSDVSIAGLALVGIASMIAFARRRRSRR